MRQNVKIIPLDGNVRSVLSAFGGTIAQNPEEISNASHLVLPGVGSFANVDIGDGWRSSIKEFISRGNKILGICFGLQVLGFSSEEGNGLGLGLIPGKSYLLPKMRMGWDMVTGVGVVYFCHQYEFRPADSKHIWLKTEDGIIAGARLGNIMGVQFHPEKSQAVGSRFIKDFLS